MRNVIRVSLAVMAAFAVMLFMCACDENAVLHTEMPSAEPTALAAATAASQPTASQTTKKSTSAPSAVVTTAQESNLPASASPAPHTLAPVKNTAEISTGSGDSKLTLPSADTKEATYVLTLDGLEYDTGIQSGDVVCYVSDVDLDGISEILVVRSESKGAKLYLFQPGSEGLREAAFTYTMPEELSDSGKSEDCTDAEYLAFSGVEPIVSLEDGSFALLTFGSAFMRYVFDGPTMRVVEAGELPLDILTGGEIPKLD